MARPGLCPRSTSAMLGIILVLRLRFTLAWKKTGKLWIHEKAKRWGNIMIQRKDLQTHHRMINTSTVPSGTPRRTITKKLQIQIQTQELSRFPSFVPSRTAKTTKTKKYKYYKDSPQRFPPGRLGYRRVLPPSLSRAIRVRYKTIFYSSSKSNNFCLFSEDIIHI